MEECKKKNICVECCPIANVGGKKVESFDKHPVQTFIKNGIPVCLNSDNL